MNDQPAITQLTIRHEPYGEQHPYEPLPYERSPRDPWAGQPVTLGVETSANPGAEAVWCTWTMESSPQVMRTEGALVENGETAQRWEIHLPALSKSEVVRYRLFARTGAQQVESEEFVMPVAQWTAAEKLLAVEDRAEGLRAILATSNPALNLELTVKLDGKGGVELRLAAVSPAAAVKNPLPAGDLLRDWGSLSLKITTSPLRLELDRKSDGFSLRAASPVEALVTPAGRVSMFRLGFESPADEAFYGFGERFNAFDQRGNSLDNYVYAQYVHQGKRSYIPVPFFISSRGYGVWINTNRQAYFDLAAADRRAWSLTGGVEQDASLELRFFFQPHPKQIVQAFTDLTGKPKLPPEWAFGLWMSSNDWNSQHEVLRQLHLTQQHQIPSSVLVIEAWSDEINFYTWNDSKYTPKPSSEAYTLADYNFPAEGRWPDPKGMIAELHQAGLKLVLWQIPVLKAGNPAEHLDETQKDADQAYAVKKGYVVTRADGSPYKIDPHSAWFNNSLVFDFSNPAAARWWMDKREYLVREMGVDGFKTDGGEHVWDRDARLFNGVDGAQGINPYPLYYQGAYNEALKKMRGSDHILFSRAGYTGAQTVSSQWAGDEASNWDAYRSTIRAMLNAGICGFSFMGWDIAGFAGPLPEVDLYLRAAAFSAFCPIMQYHSDGNARRVPSRDRTPWNMQEQSGDEEIIPLFRKFANLRINLVPYIFAQARLSHQSGLPLMRGLPLEFPADVGIRAYPYEYLFGEHLLVAPVVEAGVREWPVCLPGGAWHDLWTGRRVSGGQTLTVPVDRGMIPVYVRAGGIVPLNLGDDLALCAPSSGSPEAVKNLAALIFPGETSSAELFQGKGRAYGSISTYRNNKDGSVQINLERVELPVELLVLDEKPGQVCFNGSQLPDRPGEARNGSAFWEWLPEWHAAHIHLPARKGPLTVILR